MRIERTDLGVSRCETRPGVEAEVRAIIEEVRTGGDEAVLRLTERFDKAELGPDQLRVDARELEGSVGVLEPDVLRGLRTAIANVRAVVKAQSREPVSVDLEQGQHVEIVEVKGSVELAPLTGLVDGIVDLTATGRTLEENHLHVVEEIGVCTARLIANPVAHKLKGDQIDRIVEGIRVS